MDLNDFIIARLQIFIPLVLSLSVHEWAHAMAAFRLGDDTASLAGRLTLNPLAHIDPIGTVLLPLIGVPFGWAKPVPVNPRRFRREVPMERGMLLVAIAGPISNLIIAAVCIVGYAGLARFRPDMAHPTAPLGNFMTMMLVLNVVLASFNALPIPPLDGSRVADALMPYRLRPLWNEFTRLGPMALIAVIMLPMMMGISLFKIPIALAFELVNLVYQAMG